MKKYFHKFITVFLSLFLFLDFTTREIQLFASDASDRLAAEEFLKSSINFKISGYENQTPATIQEIFSFFLKYFFQQSFEYSISVLTKRQISVQGIPVPSLFDEMIETLGELIREQEWKGLARRYMRELRLRLVNKYNGDAEKVQKELLQNIDIWEQMKPNLSQKEKDFFAVLRQEAKIFTKSDSQNLMDEIDSFGKEGPLMDDKKRQEGLRAIFKARIPAGQDRKYFVDELLTFIDARYCERSVVQQNRVIALGFFLEDEFLDKTEGLIITQAQHDRLWEIYEEAILIPKYATKVLSYISRVLNDRRIKIEGAPSKDEVRRRAEKEFKLFLDLLCQKERYLSWLEYRDQIPCWVEHFLRQDTRFIDILLEYFQGAERTSEKFYILLAEFISPLCGNGDMKGLAIATAKRVIIPLEINSPVDTPGQTWNAIFGTKDHPCVKNTQEFLEMATLLRKLFPYTLTKNDPRPPLQFALEEGIYFPIGSGLYMTPLTESFRRHTVFKLDERGQVLFAFEVMVPGEQGDRRDIGAEQRWKVATEVIQEFPDKDYCVVPLDKAPLPKATYRLYGEEIEFSSTTSLSVMGSQYGTAEDGKRLEFLTRSMIDEIARKVGWGSEALALEIARQVAELTAATHVLGYVGYAEEGSGENVITNHDHHTGNFRLIIRKGEDIPIKVKLVDDFVVFRKISSEERATAVFVDNAHIVIGIPEASVIGLCDILHLHEMELLNTFEEAENRQILEKVKNLGKGEAFIDYGKRKNDLKAIFRNYIMTMSDKEHFRNQLLDAILQESPESFTIENLLQILSFFFDEEFLPEPQKVVLTPEQYTKMWKIYQKVENNRDNAFVILDCLGKILGNERVVVSGWEQKSEGYALMQEKFKRFLEQKRTDVRFQTRGFGYAGVVRTPWVNFFTQAGSDAVEALGVEWDEMLLEGLIYPLCQEPSMKPVRQRLLKQIVPGPHRFDVTSSVSNSQEALEAIFGTQSNPNMKNTREFFRVATLLRKVFPYELSKDDPRPPLQYAIEEGIYFEIAPGLYMTPITESFRRHIIFKMTEPGKVDFACEVLIPGEDEPRRDIRMHKRKRIAQELEDAFENRYCVKALLGLQFQEGEYEFYGQKVRFDEDTPLCILAYDYVEDGKRMEYVSQEMLSQIAIKMKISEAELHRQIAEQVAACTAATHVLGFAGRGDDGGHFDHHLGNFRLAVRQEGGKISVDVKLVGDFGVFQNSPLLKDPALRARDVQVIVEGQNRFPGLANILKISKDELYKIFREKREALEAELHDAREKGASIGFLGLPDARENVDLWSSLMRLMGKDGFYNNFEEFLQKFFAEKVIHAKDKEKFFEKLLDWDVSENNLTLSVKSILLCLFFSEESLNASELYLTQKQCEKFLATHDRLCEAFSDYFDVHRHRLPSRFFECIKKIYWDSRIKFLDDAGKQAAMSRLRECFGHVFDPAASFNIKEPIETPEQAWEAIFENDSNERAFLKLSSTLRNIYPYRFAEKDPRPPLQYAIEEGIYFKIGPNLYVTPMTGSFRRHTVFSMDESKNVKFAFEILIPGEKMDKRYVDIDRRSEVASEICNAFPQGDYCVQPRAKKKLSDGKYEMYDKEISFGFPLQIMTFSYGSEEDGKRLDHVTEADVLRYAETLGKDVGEVIEDIATQIAKAVLAVQILGYNGGGDFHLGNMRLIYDAASKKVKIKWAGDFEDFKKTGNFFAAGMNLDAQVESVKRFIGNFVDRFSGIDLEAKTEIQKIPSKVRPEVVAEYLETKAQKTRETIQKGGIVEEGISVVCPVYRELENGNFFRLIESFTNQTAAMGNYELLLLINNMPGIKGPVFEENQRTLEIARFLENPDKNSVEPDCLSRYSEEQKEIIRKARKIGLKVKVRDFSTQGIKRNIGLIRDKGVQEVIAQYVNESGGDRVVAMMDADTIVHSNYIENILVHFSDSTLNFLNLDIDFQVTGEGVDESFYKTLYGDRWSRMWPRFFATLGNHPGGGALQIVARASALKKVGGVPHEVLNEDGALISNLVELGGYCVAHDVQSVTSDRKRKDGYISADRGIKDPSSDVPRLLTTFFLALGGMDKAKVSEVSQFLGIPYNPRDSRAGFMTHMSSFPQPLDTEAMQFLKRYLPPEELGELEKRIQTERDKHEALRQRLEEAVRLITQNVLQNKDQKDWLAGISDPEVLAFFKMNTQWVYKRIQEVRMDGKINSIDDTLSYLEKEFSDCFKPYDQTRLKHQVTNIHVIINFLNEARNRPKAFPTTALLLKVLEGQISISEFLKTLPPQQIKTSNEGSTFKAPGTCALEGRKDWDREFFVRQLRKISTSASKSYNHGESPIDIGIQWLDRLDEVINWLNERRRDLRKNPVSVKRVVPRVINAQFKRKPLLGIPIFPDAHLPQDLVLFYGGMKGDVLYIYVTSEMWLRVCTEKGIGLYAKALAEGIDHEWFENMEAGELGIEPALRHRRAAERARFFASKNQLSPMHQIYFQMLSKTPFRQWRDWAKEIFYEKRDSNQSTEVQAYEEFFRKTLVNLIAQQGEEGIIFLHKLIRSGKDGGVSPTAVDLRKYIWELIISSSFGGMEKVKRIEKKGIHAKISTEDLLSLGHVIIRGTLPQSVRSPFKLGQKWGVFLGYEGSEYEVEVIDGFPKRIFFFKDCSSREFFTVIDNKTREVVDVHLGAIQREKFEACEDVTIEAELNDSGGLAIGGGRPTVSSTGELHFYPHNATFKNKSKERVKLIVRKGIIYRCTSIESDLDDEFKLIWKKSEGRYVAYYHRSLDLKEFNCLGADYEIHNLRLGEARGVHVGGRLNWMSFFRHPEAKRVDVFDICNPSGEEAFVVGANLVNEKGKVVETKRLTLIYRTADGATENSFEKGELLNVFERSTQTLLQTPEGEMLQDYIVSGLILKKEQIPLMGEYWGKLGMFFPYAEIEVKVIDGKPRFVRLLKDSHGDPILDKKGEFLVLDLQLDLRTQIVQHMDKRAFSDIQFKKCLTLYQSGTIAFKSKNYARAARFFSEVIAYNNFLFGTEASKLIEEAKEKLGICRTMIRSNIDVASLTRGEIPIDLYWLAVDENGQIFDYSRKPAIGKWNTHFTGSLIYRINKDNRLVFQRYDLDGILREETYDFSHIADLHGGIVKILMQNGEITSFVFYPAQRRSLEIRRGEVVKQETVFDVEEGFEAGLRIRVDNVTPEDVAGLSELMERVRDVLLENFPGEDPDEWLGVLLDVGSKDLEEDVLKKYLKENEIDGKIYFKMREVLRKVLGMKQSSESVRVSSRSGDSFDRSSSGPPIRKKAIQRRFAVRKIEIAA